MDDVEEKMRRMFAAVESWWPQVALVSLVQGEPSLGYEWAERCVRRLLPRVETPIRQQLLADLNVLREMRMRGASQDEFWRWSEEIWYRQPGRHITQTALSKLVWAAGCETGERPELWQLNASAPVSLLVENSRDSQEAFELCMLEYRRFRDRLVEPKADRQMTPIERILTTGPSARDSEVPIPTDEEFCRAEAELVFRFPDSYREFVRLGGLGELRIKNRVLSPSEIVESHRYLPDGEHVPFADNGCGDLYCWPRTDAAEPVVLFADHELGYTYSDDAMSFIHWLEANRF